MTPLPLRELMRPFAKAIAAKGALLHQLGPVHPRSALLRDAIKWDIKIASNLHSPNQSEKARDVAAIDNIDLRALTWGRQPSVDPGRRRFVFEHFRPVSGLRDRCVALSSVDQILTVLVEELEVVWILREEDRELTRLGYRYKRPDPQKAYDDARIRVIRAPEPASCDR